MKVHSLTILHYGKDYLPYALRSVYDHVDTCHIFYTPNPSHGHQTDSLSIETKEELQQAASIYNPHQKVYWYDMLNAHQEGPQRDKALEVVQDAGAELVVVLDCDEVWPADTLALFLSEVWERGTTRNNLVNMIHFWRSFNWACSDNGWPVRIIDLRYNDGTYYLPRTTGRIFHFGYAVKDRVMRYKWEIHGHKNELRPNWFQDKWRRWPPPDNCHPTNGRNEHGEPFWSPKLFDKLQLPEFMRAHPFWGLDKIE